VKAALYARVSTLDQSCDNQLIELRRCCEARGFAITREFIDHGILRFQGQSSRPGRPGARRVAWSIS